MLVAGLLVHRLGSKSDGVPATPAKLPFQLNTGNFLCILGTWKHTHKKMGFKVQVFETIALMSSCKLQEREFVKTVKSCVLRVQSI